MGRVRLWLVASLSAFVGLAICAGPSGAAAPVPIGAGEDDLAGIAVDGNGTAYMAWEDSSASNAFLHYCKLPAGATTCSVTYSSPGQSGGLNAPQGPGAAGLLGTPSVILLGNYVMVFAYDNGSGSAQGVAGWVSSDGGSTFTFEPPGSTMSYTPPFNDGVTTNPVSELGNGLVGVGYVVPQGSPQFQAVHYDPSTGSFQAISFSSYLTPPGPPYAKLDPTNHYAAGNLGGEFAAQPVGTSNAGVMGRSRRFRMPRRIPARMAIRSSAGRSRP